MLRCAAASYEQMVEMWREDNSDTLANRSSQGFILSPNSRIRVVVRKRPLGRKEKDCYDIASTVTSKSQQAIIIHEPKEAVDLTKCAVLLVGFGCCCCCCCCCCCLRSLFVRLAVSQRAILRDWKT